MMGKTRARQGPGDELPGTARFGTRSIAQSNCLIARTTRNRAFDAGYYGEGPTPDRSPGALRQRFRFGRNATTVLALCALQLRAVSLDSLDQVPGENLE